MRYRSHRWASAYALVVRTAQGTQRVRVVNVSDSGLRLSGLAPYAPGTPVELDFAGQRVRARVVWCRDGAAAVAVPGGLTRRQTDILRESHGRSMGHRAPGAMRSYTEMR